MMFPKLSQPAGEAGQPQQPIAASIDTETSAAASSAAATTPPVSTPVTFGHELVVFTRRRVETAPDDVQRTLAGAHVYLGLLAFARGGVRAHATLALLDLLGHEFPRVRRAVAEALYSRLLAVDPEGWVSETVAATATASPAQRNGGEYDLDASIGVLAEVVWDGEPHRVLPHRDRLYGLLLGLPQPPADRSQCGAGATGSGAGATRSQGDDHSTAGYAALVRDAGY